MRKILVAILLAGAATTPAYAAPPDQQANEAKSAHQGRAEGGKSRQTEQVRKGRVNSQAGQQRQVRAQVVRPNPQPRTRVEGAAQQTNRAVAVRPSVQQRVQVQGAKQYRQTVQPRVQNRPVSQPANRMRNVQRTRPPVVSAVPRKGTQPPLRAQTRATPQPQWSTNWRNNQRYDWGDYRRQHRSLYRQHRYHDPFGWGYQLFSIGWRLWPNYYSSNYWINDPWMYRLPPAPPGTRWIRYYNDALLVDMWSGEVIDVIHGFFW